MKRIIKKVSIVLGVILILNAALLAVIANLNIGLLPVLCLGLMLTIYGAFFDRLCTKKIVNAFVVFVLTTLVAFGSFLGIYGRNDNATYNEKTVIVLGCGIRGDTVSVGLAKRLNKAVQYHEKNPEAVIIVSGGQGPQETISEALAMKNYLAKKGIPEDKIIMEDKSTSTITNFKYSHEIMNEMGLPQDSVVFITNAYHIYRGSVYAEKEGLKVNHLGTDIKWYTVPMNYMREMLAVIKMWVFD